MKTPCRYELAVDGAIFKRAKIRRRVAGNQLAIIIDAFALDLQARGYTRDSIQSYVRVVEHFGLRLSQASIPTRKLDRIHLRHFLRLHLPRCHCRRPAPKAQHRCRAALNCFTKFLQNHKLIRDSEKRPSHLQAIDRVISRYGQHLKEVCGIAPSTQQNREHYAREFLKWQFGSRRPNLRQLRRGHLLDFVIIRARELTHSGTRGVADALRSFLRFLEFSDRIPMGLADGITRPVQRPSPRLPKILDQTQWRRFLKCFNRSMPNGRRDYAMALCLSTLGLRVGEVIGLSLDDIDWHKQTLRLNRTKQRRQRLLPLPELVAEALADYLQHGRPPTENRALFVCHRPPIGEALKRHHVQWAVKRAFLHCGIDATGTHILRHSWATWAHRRGASLKLIADVLGHKSLDTTMQYAQLNLDELRQAALPWPKAKPKK